MEMKELYRSSSIQSLYRRHEQEKKREYGDSVREIEQASFTPLVFATTGGMGRDSLAWPDRYFRAGRLSLAV